MEKLALSSNITFLYFEELEGAKRFFSDTLGLSVAFDPGWACVYRLGEKSFVGAVAASAGSIEVKSRGGVLLSLTVKNIEAWHAHILSCSIAASDIKTVKDIALKSFFFTGPEGYNFEIQQFTQGDLAELF